tara:strand:+ start:99 stop:230 length:132 start_codon:yes stop_codon:yes gene_type:complete
MKNCRFPPNLEYSDEINVQVKLSMDNPLEINMKSTNDNKGFPN